MHSLLGGKTPWKQSAKIGGAVNRKLPCGMISAVYVGQSLKNPDLDVSKLRAFSFIPLYVFHNNKVG